MIVQLNCSEALRTEIIKGARLLFQTKGFDKTTIQDLIENINVSEHMFFKYFQSMDELLEVVWSES